MKTPMQVLQAHKIVVAVITKFYPTFPVEDINALATEIIVELGESLS